MALTSRICERIAIKDREERRSERERDELRSHTNFVVLLLDDRFVETRRVLELVLLHEERVRHVQLPHVVLVAELDALLEDLLHLGVILQVPVDLGLRHQYGNISVEGLLVIGHGLLHGIVVVIQPRLLDLLGRLAKRLRMLIGEVVELAIRLLR